MALSLDASPPGIYRQRGTSSLQRLFRTHFLDLHARYEADFAKRLGRFRLERISSAVRRFMDCGDYTKGIARIQSTNSECKADYFRPFSCKVLYPLGGLLHLLCPPCSQKRILLNERLARNMLGCTHSGYSVDLSVNIPASSSKARGPRAVHIPFARVAAEDARRGARRLSTGMYIGRIGDSSNPTDGI